MEKALTEPLIVEPVLLEEDESKEEEYSEWKLLIAHVLKSSVNPGYQNRDFRKKDGTPVIDPDVYRKLQNDVTTISTWSFSTSCPQKASAWLVSWAGKPCAERNHCAPSSSTTMKATGISSRRIAVRVMRSKRSSRGTGER